MDVEIEGLEEVCDWLSKAPVAIAQVGVVSGLHAAGEVIERAIDIRTPTRDLVDHPGRSTPGRVGGDADQPSLITGLELRVQVDEQGRGGTAQIGFFGKFAPIAEWVEYGHRMVLPSETTRYIDNRGRSRKGELRGEVPAHPFIRPASDSVEEPAVDAFVAAVDDSIRQFEKEAA